ncbi:hypothetical protein GGI02_000326 [Coemansia sp. RSA 2322]|nr:hypothetical protein GGI02_000326 [Coemansia sp. RSA 2322]
MQRGPYSRETTDISDQELRQILESENISGLPAPYCLVPHYDGQVPLPQNALWPSQPPVASPSLAQQAAENALASNQLRQHPQAEHESNSSQSSPGGQNGSGASGGVDGAMAATAGNSSAQHTPVSSTASEASRRRTRTTLTPYQLRVLFRVWERTQYPSSDLRFRLATSLMMTPRNVQIWFQNQRQKTKERAEMRRRTHSPSNPSAILANMGAPPPHHQRHHPLASNQHSQAHMLEFHSHDGSSQKHPSQQSYYPASQHGGDAHCVIPSPTTPTFVAEQSSLRQSPSPAMPRRRLPSPPLSLPIHLQHVASAQGSVSHSSQTVREHPGSRRSRLADILNPISSTTFASGLTNVARSEAIHQLGPLPSLGSVLANVQSEDCESPGTDPEETRCDGASSATTSTATDKWRPW